ncbi:MAG: FliM/FliN family flagellar motor C-terminal domain-containing protein [Planctomycetota bacterium]
MTGQEGLALADAPTPAKQAAALRGSTRRTDLHRVLGLKVPISVTLAERNMSLESILAIAVGTILEFDVPVESELKLHAVNCEIAKGQAVKVGESFGFRITRIVDVHDRIGALAGVQANA